MRLNLNSRLQEPVRYEVPARPSASTLDSTALNDNTLAYILNGSIEKGVFSASRRYRTWGNAPTTTASGAWTASCLASISGTSGCEKLILMTRDNAGTGFQFYSANVSASASAAANVFGTAYGGFTEATGEWVGHQHLDRAFFVGGTNGNVRMISSICGTPSVSAMVKKAAFPSNQVVASYRTAVSDYLTTLGRNGAQTFPHPSDGGLTLINAPDTSFVISSVTYSISGKVVNYADNLAITAAGTTADGAISSSGYLTYWNISGTGGAPSNVLDYTFQTAQDYDDCDYFYVKYTVKDLSGGGLPVFETSYTTAQAQVSVQKDGSGTWTDLTCQVTVATVSTTRDTVHVWCDLTGVAADIRGAIKKIRFPMLSQSGTTLPDAYDINFHKGGKAYKMQNQVTDTLSVTTPPQEDLEYYVRYVSSDGLTVSKAIRVTVPPSAHEGVRPSAALPKIGGVVTITTSEATAPWGGSSLIKVYRKVTVRETEETRYYLLDGVESNAGGGVYTDYYSDKDLLNSTLTYTAAFDEAGELEDGVDLITNMVAGCTWKGANVLFDRSGLAYFSKVGTYNEFLFPGDGTEIDDQDVSRPRFIQITPNGLPIIAGIGQDALYMFAVDRIYAMAGDYPSSAPPASILPNLGGVLSSRACAPYFGGVVYGASDGLWSIEVPYGFNGSAEQVRANELTKNHRDCWEWVKSGGTSNMCVAIDRNSRDIWVFNNSRALTYTPETGWARIEWAVSDSVLFCRHHHLYGTILVHSSRKASVIGAFTTDAATDPNGTTGGTAFTATFETKKFDAPLRILRVQTYLQSASSTTGASLTAISERGGTQSVSFNGASPVYNAPWSTTSFPSGGRWIKFQLSLTPGTTVEACVLSLATHDQYRGK